MGSATKLIILGTGGSSLDILDTVNDINTARGRSVYECTGFLDDNASRWGTTLYGVKVLGPLAAAADFLDCRFVNGIGAPGNFVRKDAIIASAGVPPERFETVIHPSASVSRTAKLGPGAVVLQHVSITANVTVGSQVIILPSSVISHDVEIGDYTCVTGGVSISGQAKIGRLCYLGTNCSIIGGIEIGDHCLIGMGSVVLASVPSNSVVVGNPARFLRPTRS